MVATATSFSHSPCPLFPPVRLALLRGVFRILKCASIRKSGWGGETRPHEAMRTDRGSGDHSCHKVLGKGDAGVGWKGLCGSLQ